MSLTRPIDQIDNNIETVFVAGGGQISEELTSQESNQIDAIKARMEQKDRKKNGTEWHRAAQREQIRIISHKMNGDKLELTAKSTPIMKAIHISKMDCF